MTKTTKKTTTKVFDQCHKGPVEIHPGLWIGDQSEGEKALTSGLAKVAVPLNKMDGSIWEKWDGEVIYIPITDYGVLPRHIAERKANLLVDRLNNGESLSIFCMGGHGRTGYMAALALGFLGYADPIDHIRKHYCKNAIESRSQIDQIAEILDNPKLRDYEPANIFYGFDLYNTYGPKKIEGDYRDCIECVYYDYCKRGGLLIGEACDGFTENFFDPKCKDCSLFLHCSPDASFGDYDACANFIEKEVDSDDPEVPVGLLKI